jgi:hypothetical protein
MMAARRSNREPLQRPCVASLIKPRCRASRAQIEARREALFEIVKANRPCTVRQAFYQATVRGVVDKTEGGYAKVQTDLANMRRAGIIPYDWLADNTRWQRKPDSYRGVEHALEACAEFYRKNLWVDNDWHLEIWLEKDALSGVVYDVTEEYDVPLMVARGYASLSFLHSSAEYISELAEEGIDTFVYHLGDYDPSGMNAGEKIEQTLRELAANANISYQRVAVNPDQIEAWNLPTRPTKTEDTRAKRFGSSLSVELDAIDPNQLRSLVRDAIEDFLPREQLDILKVAEQSEREVLLNFAKKASSNAGS